MAYKFNPFTSNFDYYETSSGSAPTVVANFSALPAANTVSGQFYWCSASQGTFWLPGPLGGTYYSAGMYYSNGVSWEFMDVPYQATQTEVNTGTNTNKFVTPETLTNATLFQYLDATSSIQTQLNGKLATFNYFNTTSYLTVDGLTVFFGKSAAINAAGASGFTNCVPLPSGKIVKVIVGVYSSASSATTELSTLSLLSTTTTRYDTTNLISSSFSLATGAIRQNFQSFTVDIDVVAGESCMQLALATFVTNPTVILDVTVLMRLS